MGVIVTTSSRARLQARGWARLGVVEHHRAQSHVFCRESQAGGVDATFLVPRKQPDEGYTDYYQRGDTRNSRKDRVRPTTLTREEISDERPMALLYGLQTDDPRSTPTLTGGVQTCRGWVGPGADAKPFPEPTVKGEAKELTVETVETLTIALSNIAVSVSPSAPTAIPETAADISTIKVPRR